MTRRAEQRQQKLQGLVHGPAPDCRHADALGEGGRHEGFTLHLDLGRAAVFREQNNLLVIGPGAGGADLTAGGVDGRRDLNGTQPRWEDP